MKERKPPDPRSTLLKELRQSLEQIDEQGLLFLLRQAQVLIHNARAEQISQKAASRSPSGEEPAAGDASGDDGGASGAPGRRAAPAGVAIEESENGKVYFLVIGKVRKVIDGGEVRRLVRVCSAAESKSEALQRLFRVLKQERRDILMDAGIRSASSPILDAVFKAVRSWKGTA